MARHRRRVVISAAAEVCQLLRTNDKAIGRALVALNERQTYDEQSAERTKYHNQQGFRPGDAKKGTGMAKFFIRTGFLTPKQLAYWRHQNVEGKMRIEIYAGQLSRIAEEKAVERRMSALREAEEVSNAREYKACGNGDMRGFTNASNDAAA